MKKQFILSTLLLSSLAYADIDYSRCNQHALVFTNARLDNDGKLTPMPGTEITDIRTEGRVEKYKLKAQFVSGFTGGITAIETEVTLTRDKNGRVINIKTGGEKPSQQLIDMYQNTTYPGGMFSSPADLSSQQPLLRLGNESVPLDQVTDEQAQAAGIKKPVEDLKRYGRQNRKDKAAMKRITDSFAQIKNLVDYQIPFGMESELEIQDGACLLKSTSNRVYSTKSKTATSYLSSSKESCEEIKKLHKKYEPKLNECQTVTENLNKEYWDNHGSKLYQNTYSMWGGGVVGGATGGMVGGYPGGIVGGYTGGGYGGYGYGGYGMTVSGPIQAALWNCEYYYGVNPIPEFGGMGGWGEAPGSAQKQ